MILTVALLTLSLLLVWTFCYLTFFSGVQESRTQHELYATFRADVAQAEAAMTQPIRPGTPVALLRAPGGGINDAIVVEGTSSGDLRAGPGHLRSTPLPGQPGTSVVYGRTLAFGGPFRSISSLRIGAQITTTTNQGVFTYVVSDVRRAGDPTPPPLPAGGGRLTLVAADGSGWTAAVSPSRILYVDATLKGAAQPDPGGRASSVPKAEQAMQGETDPLTLSLVVFWLQLLLLVLALFTWLRTRWRRWQMWLVAVPVVFAVMWGLSNIAVRMLPNLI